MRFVISDSRPSMRSLVIVFSIVIVVFSTWLTDFVTLKGEHTVYAARCPASAIASVLLRHTEKCSTGL
jgi:hypothetical protein